MTDLDHGRHYLQQAREALLWKLDGLSEYDARRPLTPTGTNLLGLVKHLAGVELLYLGWAFDRHCARPVAWFRPDLGPHAFEPAADLWAAADEPRALICDTYRAAWAHSDATLDALAPDAEARIPWWPHGTAPLRRVLLHVLAETQRHAGHADILRELADGAAGLAPDNPFLPPWDAAQWAERHTRITASAKTAAGEGEG